MGQSCSSHQTMLQLAVYEAKIEYCFKNLPQLMTDLQALQSAVKALPQLPAVVSDIKDVSTAT